MGVRALPGGNRQKSATAAAARLTVLSLAVAKAAASNGALEGGWNTRKESAVMSPHDAGGKRRAAASLRNDGLGKA
jgi:hypothetical protein